MMKALLSALVMAALSGCVAAEHPAANSNAAGPGGLSLARAQNFSLTGTYWMPTTSGQPGAVGKVLISSVPAPGELTVTLHSGMRQAGMESPISPANAVVRINDPANRTLAES
ncbi:MAG: hypothetical protein ACYDDF_07585 [Thermoplasmatota archaeon]